MLFELRLAMLCVIVIMFVFFIAMLRGGKMDLKYCLVWLLGLFGIGVYCVFPGMLSHLSRVLGIDVAVNTLFLICILFLACICISLTIVVSRLSVRLRKLTQNIAIMECEAAKKDETACNNSSDIEQSDNNSQEQKKDIQT